MINLNSLPPFLFLPWRASIPQKSRLTTSGLFYCSSNKTFISGQNKRKFRKWYYCKVAHLLSTFETISKSTAPVGQCCILPPGLQLCTVKVIQNHTKMMFGAKHWLPQTHSPLRNCLHTWPPQEYSLPCIIIIPLHNIKIIKFLCILHMPENTVSSCSKN